MVRFENGIPVGVEAFAAGWLDNESVSGRPEDLLILRDGSMLVSDDHAGKLYRISYTEGQIQEQNL
jgi:glucose/arabinose dehydrogenase